MPTVVSNRLIIAKSEVSNNIRNSFRPTHNYYLRHKVTPPPIKPMPFITFPVTAKPSSRYSPFTVITMNGDSDGKLSLWYSQGSNDVKRLVVVDKNYHEHCLRCQVNPLTD